MTTAGTASRRMTCRKNDGPPGSVCRDRKSGRSPAFGNRLGQGLLTEHSIRSHTAPAGPPLWRTAGAVLFCGGQYRRLPQGADAGWAVQDFEGYLLLKPAMHPSVGSAAITGLRSPHHVAHAEACLHSATAAPAPSRCIRRRRRSTPQPLAGEPFQTAVTRKAGKTNTARNTAVPGCIVLYRDPGQGVLIRKSLRQTADGTSPPMGGNLAPRRRTLPAQIVLEGRCVKFNHLRAVKKQWITGGCACAGQPDRRQRQPRRAR